MVLAAQNPIFFALFEVMNYCDVFFWTTFNTKYNESSIYLLAGKVKLK